MTTKRQTFQRDEEKRSVLRNALPVVVEALEALKDDLEGSPRDPSSINDTLGNSCYQQIIGARYLIKNLPELAKAETPVKRPKGRRQYTEEDREDLKARQEDA